MKKTFWSFGLVLAALVVLVAPGATTAEEAGVDLPAVQAAVPAPADAPAPAEALPLDLTSVLEAPVATPVAAAPEALEPALMACWPPECSSSADCGGGRCRAKCCV